MPIQPACDCYNPTDLKNRQLKWNIEELFKIRKSPPAPMADEDLTLSLFHHSYMFLILIADQFYFINSSYEIICCYFISFMHNHYIKNLKSISLIIPL